MSEEAMSNLVDVLLKLAEPGLHHQFTSFTVISLNEKSSAEQQHLESTVRKDTFVVWHCFSR